MTSIIRLFATSTGVILQRDEVYLSPASPLSIDAVFQSADPVGLIGTVLAKAKPIGGTTSASSAAGAERGPPANDPFSRTPGRQWTLRAPVQSQEVWAAGVTYFRSRTARMEESKVAGGGSFYDRVYEADRPELFFTRTPHRVAGRGKAVRIRAEGKWNVPEPEL